MDTATFRRDLTAWLDEHTAELTPPFEGNGTLEEQMAQYRRVKGALWDADFGRYGWPEAVGGLGGPTMFRAIVGEEIASRELADPSIWTMIEVLAPTVSAFGSPELVAEMVPLAAARRRTVVPGLLRARRRQRPRLADVSRPPRRRRLARERAEGVDELRPVLAALRPADPHRRTRQRPPGHHGVLRRRRHRRASSPSPIEAQHGRFEFAEVFFDDVFVPDDRRLGDVGQGWQVAMDVLPYERSTTFWHRGAHLHHRCDQLVERVAAGHADDPTTIPATIPATTAKALGEAFQAVIAFRSRSRDTQFRLAAGETLGAETSIDKILIATAEQLLLETARDVMPGVIEFDDDLFAERWREEYLYSKAATIYGGTSEIQRNIVARRLLDLGAES